MAKDKVAGSGEGVKKLGTLISRKPHNVTISYDGEALVIPPRGSIKKIDKNRLGALPKDVIYVE